VAGGGAVEIGVPAAALELEAGVADQALDLVLVAGLAGADRILGDLLDHLELVAAGITAVLVDGHGGPPGKTSPLVIMDMHRSAIRQPMFLTDHMKNTVFTTRSIRGPFSGRDPYARASENARITAPGFGEEGRAS
jgi:hypothetical protein